MLRDETLLREFGGKLMESGVSRKRLKYVGLGDSGDREGLEGWRETAMSFCILNM